MKNYVPVAFFLLSLLATTSPARAQSDTVATIVNSGSTNIGGYRITVTRNGVLGADAHGNIDPADAAKFFTDIAAAQPFSSLSPVHCMKSASFGTTMHIAFGGEETPDISCAGEPKTAALYRDAQDIAAKGGLQARPRHRLVEPQ